METIFARLTVYFDDPFWVGVYERQENGPALSLPSGLWRRAEGL